MKVKRGYFFQLMVYARDSYSVKMVRKKDKGLDL